MCGIAGVFNYRGPRCLAEIGAQMSAAMQRRGPDDAGIFFQAEEGTLLVHRRLSIIDLSSAGHQPMFSPDGRYAIIYNGEVYNFAEIRAELEKLGHSFQSNTDSEVILYAYIQWGVECLPRLRGMFAFAIYDRSGSEPELFIARDRFGIKPLVYAETAEGFAFASESGVLRKSGLLGGALSRGALQDFLVYGAVRQPQTIFIGARQLQPGHYLRYSGGHLEERRWYNLVESTQVQRRTLADRPYSELVELTRAKLEDAAKYHVIADTQVGAFLSGGVDSAAVTALMGHHLQGAVKAFSIGFVRQREVVDELSIARESAEYLGAEHVAISISDMEAAVEFPRFVAALDQPSIDGFNTFLVSKHTANSVRVALSGLGGDELFAGYPHYAQILAASKTRLPGALMGAIRRLHELRPNRITRGLLYRGISPAASAKFFRQYLPCNTAKKFFTAQTQQWLFAGSADEDTEVSEDLSALAAISQEELGGYLLSTLLRDSDVCSMNHSLELRPILLDHELVELVFSLPDSCKLHGGRAKAVLADAVAGLIPQGCAGRRKSGFEMPFGRWLSGELNETFIELLHGENARILLTEKFRKKLQALSTTPTGARGCWRWLVLLAWLEAANARLFV